MTFSQKLVNAIELGLETALGEQAARSIGFFIDPKIALKDPQKYWDNLDKMFKHDSATLKEKLISNICSYFGIQVNHFNDLGPCIEAAKKQFLKDDLAERFE
jgi:hypothetical protein